MDGRFSFSKVLNFGKVVGDFGKVEVDFGKVLNFGKVHKDFGKVSQKLLGGLVR
jgi:hypothetical protein